MQQVEERPVIDDAGRYVQIQQQPATDVNSVSTPFTVCRRVAIFGPQLMQMPTSSVRESRARTVATVG